MKKYILFLLAVLFTMLDSYGQKTRLGFGFEGYKMTSLQVATSLDEAYQVFEDAILILKNEKEFTLYVASDFSDSDRILEFIKVDTCINCFFYERYIINISTGLSSDTYRALSSYARKMSLREDHYMYESFYNMLLARMRNMISSKVINEKLPEKQASLYRSILEEFVVSGIEVGDLHIFDSEFYRENYITDAVCAAIIKQLKHPKFPPYLLEQYMDDNKHRWDPALVDTTGIPQKYIKDQLFMDCPSSDTLCKKYIKIIYSFKHYERIAKEQGITPAQALYNYIENDFFYKGFKRFTFMIDYAIEKKDMRLLPALKEFIKKYPDYQLTNKQREFLEKI